MTVSFKCSQTVRVVILFLLTALLTAPSFATDGNKDATTVQIEDQSNIQQRETSGSSLTLMNAKGEWYRDCPLKKTTVSAEISGFVAHVTVTQTFKNNAPSDSDALYSFPLSDSAAISQMEMKIGSRTIQGSIKKREEARQIFEQAKLCHQTASLLDEERPNIFTQRVANLKPGVPISISLKYTEMLPFASGTYTFSFPTAIGPRFCLGKGVVPTANTQEARPKFDIKVQINGGLNISNVRSLLHPISLSTSESNNATIRLENDASLGKLDFVLKWDVSGSHIKSGFVAHRTSETGYFTLMLMPTKTVVTADAAPKELIFIVDCSGSQSGKPLEQAKATLSYILDRMNPQDTFQIIAFSDGATSLFNKPESAGREMRERAKSFISSLSADGGTFMAPAVEAACSVKADRNRLRIVTIMTDGYIGNDYEILGLVRKLRGTSRWFSFGTGNCVNRFLIDGIAKEGGGEAEYVLLNSSAQEIAAKFYKKISAPILTDVRVDFGNLSVADCYPAVLSDVWEQRPLYISGKYTKPGFHPIKIRGNMRGLPYEQTLVMDFPRYQPANASVDSVWARAKIDFLMSQDWQGMQSDNPKPMLKEAITAVALEHHIVTPFTSFVAVDDRLPKEICQVVGTQPAAPYNVSTFAGQNGSVNECYRGLHKWFQDSSGGGLVGAPVDPRYGQSCEVGQLADYGYDSARDVCRMVTGLSLLVAIFVSIYFLRNKRLSLPRRLWRSAGVVFGVPTVVHLVGTFMINNFGGIGGGL